MAKPVKRRVSRGNEGGRVTPKGTTAGQSAPAAPTPTSRYTPPVPRSVKVSAPWVPVLMFALLGIGMLMILLNYVGIVAGSIIGFLPDDTSNVYLLIGLGFILGGIVTATQYH